MRGLSAYAAEHDIASPAFVAILWARTPAMTNSLTRALAVVEMLREQRPDLRAALRTMERATRDKFPCWSGNLTRRFEGKNPAYPLAFEIPTLFPGRTTAASLYPPPTETERIHKPWLHGLPRLIFVNDMGDALSKSIEFESLRTEIIEPCTTPAGSRHIWLWLSKRPHRMAEFHVWLGQQGLVWPRNLIPMCSPINAGYARAATALLDIPAAAHGYSVEPWDSWVDLPKELFRPNAWFILGGGSQAGAKPFDLMWARRLRDQVGEFGGEFFLKQLGRHAVDNGAIYHTRDLHGGDWQEWPRDLRVRDCPHVFRHLTSAR